MAYLKPLVRACQVLGCIKQATVELCARHNAAYGVYCHPHGEERLRALQADEDARSSASMTRM